MHKVTDENSVETGSHLCSLTFYEEAKCFDIAYVSEDLWRDLVFLSGRDLDTGERLAISLTLSKPDLPKDEIASTPELTFWIYSPTISPLVPTSGIAIPAAFKFRFLFNSSQEQTLCNVTLTQPLLLLDVFISTQDPEIFRFAQKHQKAIEYDLCKDNRLLRTGDCVWCIEESGKPFAFDVTMAEPVLQGFGKEGQTRFLLSLHNSKYPYNKATDDTEVGDLSAGLSNNFHSDDFTIDERFLASTALDSFEGTLEDSDKSTVFWHGKGNSLEGLSLKAIRHTVDPMFDESYVVFAHTEVLGTLGVFDGDWAVGQCGEEHRLVRIYASDQFPATDLLYAAPNLLRNCTREPGDIDALPIHIIPLGASLPPVPTAKSVTLARISSPVSSDRPTLNLQFLVLKSHLERHKRLIKKSDLIAVPLCTELGDMLKRPESDDEMTISSADLISDVANIDYQPNAMAFFVVTELEYDIANPKISGVNKGISIECARGDFGCWLDSSLTKVVQSGVEHSGIPNILTYSGVSSISDNETQNTYSDAHRRLIQVLEACARGAIDFGSTSALLMIGSAGSSMITAARQNANRLGYHLQNISAYELLDETETKTLGKMKDCFISACAAAPCILIVESIDALMQSTQPLEPGKESAAARTFKNCMEELYKEYESSNKRVVVVATAESADRLPPTILTCFKEQVNFEVPDESERRSLLTSMTINDQLGPDVSIQSLATQTAALGIADLLNLVQRARHAAMKRIFNAIVTKGHSSQDIVHSGLTLLGIDFDKALTESRASYSQSIGAPSIPSVSWDDVGGLASVKGDILDTIQLPLDNPELFADGLKQRSGILLYGPPGTGKTLLAKAVATSCSLNFFSVKGPELLNMYIGESEANVRRIFQRARDAKPCVIFFDELDSIAPKRGNHGDSGGVMDRIVSQLLAELDGMSSSSQGADVFVIGATNRPDLLDPALLRPGRFDKMLYLGISDTHEAQLNILEALTRKFRLDPNLNLTSIAELCPFNYTGADFYALCSDAMLKAMARKAEEVQTKINRMNEEPRLPHHQYPLTPQYYLNELASSSDTDVLVNRGDFLEALNDLVPSVSQAELDHYKEVQERFTQN